GELKAFYQTAEVVFVGKSLTAQGGQNPIEPAALGKAIITGPNMQNFRSIMQAFARDGAIVTVQDVTGFANECRRLLADETARKELGAKALAVVERNSGAIARTVEMLLRKLTANSPSGR